MPTPAAVNFLWLIPAFPLLGVLFNTTIGPRLGRRAVNVFAPGVIALAFVTAVAAVWQLTHAPAGTTLVDRVYEWIHVGTLQLDVAFRVDPLTSVMILVVTGVGFLIHVYSAGYMAHDDDYARYFAYLNLFTCAMLVLVLADNIVVLFVGWEGVGLCSYLLIGFWYSEPANADAGKKAFIVNRVGDAGFLLGTFLLFWNLGPGAHDLSFRSIAAAVGTMSPSTITAIALLLFVGATGKSAQLPLYVWLPDAMAGPTPVSALIHAATMVTAGIYMIARLNFLYVLTPTAMSVVGTVGALTAVFAATIGLVQTDIKKVLAYSTISQLGYMFLALGVGAFGAAVFHLMTHAFFKALLFLGAGSVIHGMSGEQDIRKMGGLQKHMPRTYRTFLIGTLAIAGVPGLAGFFSKDQILFNAFAGEHGNPALWALGAVGAGLTAFYMTRLLILTFWGECRADAHTQHHIHESPPSMVIPLIVLAFLSVVGGYVGLPEHWLWGDKFAAFLAPVFGAHEGGHEAPAALEYTLMLVSVAIAFTGIGVAYFMYVVQPEFADRLATSARGLYQTLLNKYFVDEIYEETIVQPTVRGSAWLWRVFDAQVVDGAANGVAQFVAANAAAWRRMQDGNVQHYALSFFVGVAVILAYFVWR